MFKKPIYLVVLFGVLFAILISIQVYFLMNSYSLKKREIFAQVKSELTDLEDDVDIFDDDVAKDDDALARFIKLEKGEINDSTLRANYKMLSDHIQPRLTFYIDSVFKPIGYQVKVYKEIVSVYSHNQHKELINEPLLLYKSAPVFYNKQVLSSGKWETSSNRKNDEVEEGNEKGVQDYGFTVRRMSYFEITNLQYILFKELFLLISISVILLIAILIVFYRSYKNLMEQRRQIENLHDMVDNVAHELRTPVGTLKVVSKTLEKLYPSEVVQVLGRQVDRLELVLRPLTQQESLGPSLLFTQEDLDKYIEDFQFSNPSIVVQAEPLPQEQNAIIKDDMTSILSNLLGNSVKYGATEIVLTFDADEGIFTMTVKDNGKGINKEDQPYIFEKFYRIQKDNIHQTKGMGLGLYIVSQLVKKYKGTIKVDSTIEQGTIFQITIPHE